MQHTESLPPGSPQLSSAVIELQLQRILASTTLARANYLAKLLKCCVEQTLAGNGGQLKEIWLGIAIFKRESNFDPRHDPIVRVQARRLREKLALYYRTEGLMDDLRITMPVGSYIPVFTTIDVHRWASLPSGRPCSIAVLPMAALSPSPEAALFADVMTMELTHSLVEVGGLEVVSRTSAMAYKGIAVDIRTVGRMLNADFIVEGCVRMEDGHHRTTLQLTACDTGYHCRAAWFEHRNSRIGSDVRRIAELLRQELNANQTNPLSATPMLASVGWSN